MNPTKKSWAEAKANQEFIELETYSGYWNFLPDPHGKKFHFPITVSDEELGRGVLEALSASRILKPQENPAFFDIQRVSHGYQNWVQELINIYGYKTKHFLFKKMKSCSIKCQENIIIIIPSHHEKLEAWSGYGIHEDDYMKISANSSPEEIGAGLRTAFSRCT